MSQVIDRKYLLFVRFLKEWSQGSTAATHPLSDVRISVLLREGR